MGKDGQKRFHILTFGCQMNAGDSAWLAGALRELGYVESARAEADIHILNTCSVRDKPENKVYTELGQIRLLAEAHPEREILACVGGCVAQQLGSGLFARSRELRLLFGADGLASAPGAIDFLVKNPGQKIGLLDFSPEFIERPPKAEPGATKASVFVNIMQGCDNFCAYCIVPQVRGRQKSRKSGAVLEECRRFLDCGAREITLLGQNVNSFGLDSQGDGTGFSALLRRTAALPGLLRLRFMTSHPKDLDSGLIRAFAEIPQLAPHLHLPLQSGSDRILRSMGRGYTLKSYLNLVEKLRAARPGLQISTDLIVGFPGEEEEDFEATLEAMWEADFCASFSFVYSDRPGTRAKDLPGKIPRRAALERLARLQERQNLNSGRILRSLRGTSAQVLIEGKETKPSSAAPEAGEEGETWYGREAGGFHVLVSAPLSRCLAPGDLAEVIITGSGKHTLKGRIADK
ncbi:MAG: tRNA (N6-isopentenyl adenosine(37)-C2)-methylthiotransferase MiaB [Deltaproteobacteria bacterium]|jgi:tRNA-2-methylthio-N6-dimethylallyladenosine synthase|nr:tRNA (N6-isopentenyl adenosine(37)-C2)-methylthiotransferase MiaB [Deltaproteobacteria bacterium]